MNKYSAVRWLIFASALSFAGLSSNGADPSGNLITNGAFEAGIQDWKGDGRIVMEHDGNRVCEIEASKARMKEIHQEFHMKQLQQVEVVFRARSIDYKGPGIRISVHQPGSGSVFWTKELPEDGSWRDFHIKYTRTTANVDLRDLVIATLIGVGKIQIDDVEVREPSKMADNEPSLPPEPAPAPTPKPAPPLAFVKPTPAPAPLAPAPPAVIPRPSTSTPQPVPPGTVASLVQIINSTPASILLKLQDAATLDAGATEANQYFARNVKGQPAQLHLSIDKVDQRNSSRNKFLIHVTDRLATTWDGNRLAAWMWLTFPEDSTPSEDKIASGSEITVSGVVSRCEVGKTGHLHLNLDLVQSKLMRP
jgi:hypothetical protein